MLHRFFPAILLLLAGSVSAPAQTFTLPEIGLQNSGACPQIAVRERTGKTMVPLGCIDGTSKVIRWAGDGSGISLTPSTAAATGTLARLMADRAPLASPAFTGALTNTLPAGCTSTTAGGYTNNGLATWVPSCFGTWLSADLSNITIYPTRGMPSTSGAYPPGDPNAVPVAYNNNSARFFIQSQADGNVPKQTSGAFINMDIVGGSVSEANPSTPNSPNATGMMITSQQRPSSSGQRPPTYWGINIDHVTAPGSGNVQTYGIEMDMSNFNADCKPGPNCLSAFYFYGGIAAFPHLAIHYIANPHTQSFSGQATASGNIFTKTSGEFNDRITRLSYAGQTFRVDCTTTTCTADRPVGNNATPGDFRAHSAMAHFGMYFQDSADGTWIQDADFFTQDSARTIMLAAGNHRIGLDFTQDAMPFAALFKPGQNVCYNGAAACMSFSSALNSWLFQSGPEQGSFGARIDTSGAGYFTTLASTGATITSVATVGSAGSTQATATGLNASASDVVVAAAGPGVRLNGTVGFRQEIFNNSGTAISVYPASGQQIGTAGANVAVTLASGAHAAFICFTATQCRQAP